MTRDDLEKQIRELEAAREKIERTRDALGDTAADLALDGLDARLSALAAELEGEGRADGVPTGIHARDRGVAIQGDAPGAQVHTGDLTIALGDLDDDALLDAYLRTLENQCDQMPLGVVDAQFVDQRGEVIRLRQVYVELDAIAADRRPDEDERGFALRLAHADGDRRTPLLQALADGEAPGHVLTGDAGSGKTIFAHRMCQRLAAGEEVPEPLAGLIPVRILLRDLGPELGGLAEPSAGFIWQAIERSLEADLGQAAGARLAKSFQQRLRRQGGFFVFDGLDEIPSGEKQRQNLISCLRLFIGALHGTRSRFLVTARPYAYADRRWQLSELGTLALAPFSKEQVELFLTRWYRSVRPAFGWRVDEADRRRQQLLDALELRPELGDFASRPLLLTLMATLHSSWGRLPEDRAQIFDETIKLLLGRWKFQEGRSLTDEEAPGLEIQESDWRSALSRLALQVHERQGSEDQESGEPADIPEGDLLAACKALQLPGDALIRYLEHRASLLVERRPGVYAFPHRSFQEFLAACELLDRPEPAAEMLRHLRQDPAWWREVVLLGHGFMKRVSPGQVLGMLNAFLPEDPPADPPSADDWPIAAIVGQALLDLRLKEDRPEHRALVKRVRNWLELWLDGDHRTSKERLEAGDILGRLGDPRRGVACRRVGDEAVPDIQWREIPPGRFTMGSAEDDEHAWDDERPRHEPNLERFWIGRYPITNAQYRPFVEAGGYDDERWWTPEGWDWIQKAEADTSWWPEDWPEENRKAAEDWLRQRTPEQRRRPRWWGHSKMTPSRPVVGVCWYEAMAYASWLAQVLEKQSLLPAAVEGYEVQLPNEAQWEKAARGEDGRRWPWGDRFEPGYCNSEEEGLKDWNPVGIFKRGASPYEVEEMVGNVWEWTSSRWGQKSLLRPDYGYPFDEGDGREEKKGLFLRVIRGGSWYDNVKFARCASRVRSVPHFDGNILGFRVVFSLAVSDS